MGGELERKGVETLSKIADVLEKMVVGDQRRDGREESGGGGDEGLGDAGSNGTKTGGAGGAEAGEGVNDAPDRAEQTDERSDAGGGREPRHAFFDAADFVGSGELHADRDGLERFDPRVRIVAFARDLRLKFTVAGSINVRERRAGGDDALRIGHTLGGAKDFQELVRLTANAAEDSKLLENQSPGNEREKKKKQENSTGDKASLLENVENVADYNGG